MQLQPPGQDFNPYAPPEAGANLLVPVDTLEHVLARRGSRLVARLLDGLVLMVGMIPGIVAMVITLQGHNDVPAVGFSLMGIGALGVCGYQWYLLATTAQTLGKKWMRIRIVRADGSPTNFVNLVVLRNWVIAVLNSVPGVGGVVGLADVLFIFGKEQRCLHDLIAGTKVIEDSGRGA
jgi:uncharacterized RDD family membrane protein YckC